MSDRARRFIEDSHKNGVPLGKGHIDYDTFMKRLLLTAILTLLVGTLPSQAQIFVPSDPISTTATYRVTGGQADEEPELTIKLIRVEGNRVWYAPEDKVEDATSLYCIGDKVYLSLDDLRDEIKRMTGSIGDKMMKVDISGDFGNRMRVMPLRGKKGQTFPDQSMTVSVKALRVIQVSVDVVIKDDRILRTEEIDTPLGRRDTIVRRFVVRTKSDDRIPGNREYEDARQEYTQWIIPGRGLVREEMRSGDGSLRIKELTAFHKP